MEVNKRKDILKIILKGVVALFLVWLVVSLLTVDLDDMVSSFLEGYYDGLND